MGTQPDFVKFATVDALEVARTNYHQIARKTEPPKMEHSVYRTEKVKRDVL